MKREHRAVTAGAPSIRTPWGSWALVVRAEGKLADVFEGNLLREGLPGRPAGMRTASIGEGERALEKSGDTDRAGGMFNLITRGDTIRATGTVAECALESCCSPIPLIAGTDSLAEGLNDGVDAAEAAHIAGAVEPPLNLEATVVAFWRPTADERSTRFDIANPVDSWFAWIEATPTYCAWMDLIVPCHGLLCEWSAEHNVRSGGPMAIAGTISIAETT